VNLNCAAIAATLSDAELFGHREGAFSGATKDRAGVFEQADEGTLFLDEIGELTLDCQAKLLRVIEGKGFRPVGATSEVHADVRVLAATHRDLAKMVQEGKFRQDLFFRLGLPLRVPPLRDRAEDVPALVEHFLPRMAQEHRRPLHVTPAALARLQRYDWPGNVRQLLTVLQNAASLIDGDAIGVNDLRLDEVVPVGDSHPVTLNLVELEVWAIRESLRRTDGIIAQSARLLGIHRDTLGEKIRKYDIDRDNP
jgi:Nif-specific regulatory protein